MTRIVTSHYRYKRPPRRKKAVPLEVPAVVTISDKTRRRVSDRAPAEAATDGASTPAVASDDDRTPSIVQAKKPRTGSVAVPVEPQTEPAPANDDRKSVIVTARRPGKRRYADVPEMTEEEHRAAGDRADAMMQEFKRQIAEKLRP
jgi:hypothetical protein